MASDETPEQAAERLLPCNCSLHGSVAATSLHDLHCHARLRPAVAAALRERDGREAVTTEALRQEMIRADWLTAERDRLRAALEAMFACYEGVYDHYKQFQTDDAQAAEALARAALEGTP